jgi:hypothetical protein
MFEEEIALLELRNRPAVIGKYSGKSLILMGAAHCLWKDMEPFWDKGFDLMGVNYAGLLSPFPLDHWCTQHTGYVTSFWDIRSAWRGFDGKTDDYLFHSHVEGPHIDVVWDSHQLTGGTSAWGGAVYATLMGYDPIVLAGIPLDGGGHFYDPPYGPKDQAHEVTQEHLRMVWQWAQDNIFRGKVKSMSGLTRDICGAPE